GGIDRERSRDRDQGRSRRLREVVGEGAGREADRCHEGRVQDVTSDGDDALTRLEVAADGKPGQEQRRGTRERKARADQSGDPLPDQDASERARLKEEGLKGPPVLLDRQGASADEGAEQRQCEVEAAQGWANDVE